MDEQVITILYTQNIEGDLDSLPRMSTVLQRLRREASDERVLLLDMGRACVSESADCEATEGRAALMVLDAIGVDAANVTGYLSDTARDKLRDNLMDIALADTVHPFVADKIAFADVPPPAHPHTLHIGFATGEQTRLAPVEHMGFVYTLTLQTIARNTIGRARVHVSLTDTRLLAFDVHPVSASTPPDPTISGAVEFVRDEVRYYQKVKRRKG